MSSMVLWKAKVQEMVLKVYTITSREEKLSWQKQWLNTESESFVKCPSLMAFKKYDPLNTRIKF